MRVVLDSNVLIAAFAARGLCSEILESCLLHHEIVLSDQILEEVTRNLRKKLKAPPKVAGDVGAFLKKQGTIRTPRPLDPGHCRDLDDLGILGLLEAGSVDCLVTGDEDLLSHKSFGSVPILPPREFWILLRKRRS